MMTGDRVVIGTLNKTASGAAIIETRRPSLVQLQPTT